MKSASKCDVEITITMDGMETVEPVPECLQDTFLDHSSKPGTTPVENHVTLPRRFVPLINNCTDAEKEEIRRETSADGVDVRRRDLDTATDWVRQEISIMKEQDKMLMRQFVTLRSQILHLKSMYDCHSSNSDLSFDGSTVSLDDYRDPEIDDADTCTGDYLSSSLDNKNDFLGIPGVHNAISNKCSNPGDLWTSSDLNMTQFRDRTTSLLTPKNSILTSVPVTRIKWKSHEYL